MKCNGLQRTVMDDKVAALLQLTGTVHLEGGDVLYKIHNHTFYVKYNPECGKVLELQVSDYLSL